MKTIHDENGKGTTTATFTEFHPKWVQMDLFRWAGIPDLFEDQSSAKSEDSQLGFALRSGL